MFQGMISGELAGDEITKERVLRLAFGENQRGANA
jgi:hypothetical protein